jgi:hypothetical protein
LQIAWRIWVHYWLTPVDVFDESSNGDDDGISNTHDDDTNKHKQLLERILKVYIDLSGQTDESIWVNLSWLHHYLSWFPWFSAAVEPYLLVLDIGAV